MKKVVPYLTYLGTRPILPDELEQYELHHRARIAIKPGITGMWQVSGRSDITDFEEIVRLDTEYISEWNIGLDIKILFKTVLAVLKRDVLYVITSWLPHYQLHYSWPITTAIRRIAAQLMFTSFD